jgi:fructokinase
VIAVGGEALVDLVTAGGRLNAVAGGGPFNTAAALGRLEVPVAFLGRISTDRYGRMIEQRLAESGVDLRYVLHSERPTPLAVVHTEADGEAAYTFYLAETAYADLTRDDLPRLAADVVAIHVGTLALATDPPAAYFEALIERESGARVIVLDPNVRPVIFGDQDRYRERFERWLDHTDVVKLSADDAAWLYPGTRPEDVAEAILERGARLVAITLGSRGALAVSRAGRASCAAHEIDVVDTVGAGDAFGAGLLRSLWEAGALDPAELGRLGPADLARALALANTVSGLQCTRSGAVPPSLAEVRAFAETTERI